MCGEVVRYALAVPLADLFLRARISPMGTWSVTQWLGQPAADDGEGVRAGISPTAVAIGRVGPARRGMRRAASAGTNWYGAPAGVATR